MSSVLFVSDLHLGHAKIREYAKQSAYLGAFRGGKTLAEHDAWVIERMLAAKPTKNTTWYILGDIAFEEDRLPLLDLVPGRKNLIMGNHDLFNTRLYLKHFYDIRGSFKRYGMWLSHIPLPEHDLLGFPNIHGHQHYYPLRGNNRYFNACIEFLPNNIPVSLEWLREEWLPEAQRLVGYTHKGTQYD